MDIMIIREQIRWFVKVGLVISSILILSNYYYFYFVDFEQGSVTGGGGFVFLKILGLLLFYFMILSPSFKRHYCLAELTLLLFFFFSILLFFLKRWFFEAKDYLFLNMLICALPFLVFQLRERGRILFFLDACLVVLVFQIFIDILVYLNGSSLWENKAFIGGVGNPSSFGFICNIFIAYILFFKRSGFLSFFSFCTLLYGVVMTNSMLSLLLFGGLLVGWGWSRGGRYLVLLGVIGLGLILAGYDRLLSGHLAYKLESLVSLVMGEAGDSSASVSLRVEIHRFFWEQINSNFFEVFLYGYPELHYYNADSQYLSYIGSFGVLGSLLFFFGVISSAFFASRRGDKFASFSTVVISMFLLIFFSNRILDYYPVPLFLFLMISSASFKEATAPMGMLDIKGAN